VSDLNRLYRKEPALHGCDFEGEGFAWIDCHDSSQSVLSYLRKGQHGELVAVVLNFTPIPRENYRIGVPLPGFYREVLNSDADVYGGSNVGNSGGRATEPVSWMNQPHSVPLNLPPLGGLILVHEPEQEPEEVKEEEEDAEAPPNDAASADAM
jgi:1,4-alpha-glucan branching enzyme